MSGKKINRQVCNAFISNLIVFHFVRGFPICHHYQHSSLSSIMMINNFVFFNPDNYWIINRVKFARDEVHVTYNNYVTFKMINSSMMKNKKRLSQKHPDKWIHDSMICLVHPACVYTFTTIQEKRQLIRNSRNTYDFKWVKVDRFKVSNIAICIRVKNINLPATSWLHLRHQVIAER